MTFLKVGAPEGTIDPVDLEIFVVKLFLWFAQTTKIKKTKYILQGIIIIAGTFLFAQYHTTSTAGYFTQDGLFLDTSRSLELMANGRQLFALCPINHLSLLPQYMPTSLFGSLLHTRSSLTAAW